MLEEVCASPQGPGARFVQSHLDDLKTTLLDSLRSTSSPAKRVRPPKQPRSACRRMGDTRGGPPWRPGTRGAQVALRGPNRHSPLPCSPV